MATPIHRERIYFPYLGQNVQVAASDQPEFTCRESLNVRGMEAPSGKQRGGPRAGHGAFLQTPLVGGPVQALARLVNDVPRLKYKQAGLSDEAPITVQWKTSVSPGSWVFACVPDINGDLYVLTPAGEIYLVSNDDGEIIHSFSLPADELGLAACSRLMLDESGALYAAATDDSGFVGKVFRLKRLPRREGFLDVDWEFPIVGKPQDFLVRDGSLWVSALTALNTNEIQRYTAVLDLEPILRWSVSVPFPCSKIGGGRGGVVYCAIGTATPEVKKLLPDGTVAWTFTGSGVGQGVDVDEDYGVYCIGKKAGGLHVIARKLVDLGTDASTDEGAKATSTLNSPSQPVDGSTVTIGTTVYTFRDTIDNAVEREVQIGLDFEESIENLVAAIEHGAGGGTAYSSATDQNTEVGAAESAPGVMLATVRTAGTEGNAITTATTIPGASWTSATFVGGVDGEGAWTYQDAADDPYTQATNIRVDPFDQDLFVPVKSVAVQKSLERFDGRNGTRYFSLSLTDGADQQCFDVAFNEREREYKSPAIRGPNTCYIVANGLPFADTPRDAKIYRIPLVKKTEEASADAKVRQHIHVAVCGGTLQVFERGDVEANVPTGGSAAFSATSPFLQIATLYGLAYITDGYRYAIYNPDGYDEDPRLDKLEEWKVTVGRRPEFARVLSACFGTLFLGRFADDPHNYVMPHRDDPSDFDYFPVEPDSRQAVAGNFGGTGKIQEVLTAFFPYTDDLGIIGTDSAIYRMTGHPASGGQVDALTEQYGIAFGSGFAKDSTGVLYCQGSNGSVLAIAPGAPPVKISANAIDSELAKIDLVTYKAGLAWDERLECLHVYVMRRRGVSSSLQKHFVWEKRRAWWTDSWKRVAHQPTAISLYEGDLPQDRCIVMGCEDGAIRFIDPTRADDDGEAFPTSVLIGPINMADPGMSSRIWGLQIALATGMHGCFFDWLVGESPDAPDRVVKGGFLKPGQNPIRHKKAKGNWIWLRLRSFKAGVRWGFESAACNVTPTGRARVKP